MKKINQDNREDIALTGFFEKHRKLFFYLIAGIAFITIYAYNLLTPYLSDDYAYLIDVRKAHSLLDLVRQQYGEYLSNSGRIIGQFNVRLSLSMDKQIFNVINSLMFLLLAFLIYANIQKRKKYDSFVLLTILSFLWLFSVEFGQTMLWICGACNYLWGSVIILLFITVYRKLLQQPDRKHAVLVGAGMFLLGVLAGWCNENTSGGGLFLVLLYSLNFWTDRRKEKRKTVYPFMVSGIAGMCCGLIGMVMAPGVRKRSATMSEGDEYTGIVGLLSRTYKVIVNMHELFLVLMIMAVLILVLLSLQGKLKTFARIRTNDTVLFILAFLATSFVLALIPTPANRAFFGAGVFLMIACIQGIVEAREQKELAVQLLTCGLVSVLCMILFFTYVENLVDLARIYREENERIALIEAEHGENEDGIVVIPQFREEFRTVYSVAHDSDLTDDKEYWINHFYEIYYDIGNITAIPRDQWDERYGSRE